MSLFCYCEGYSKIQVATIATSIKDRTKAEVNEKPFAVDGFENSEWIAMDYGTILVRFHKRVAIFDRTFVGKM